MNLLVPEVVRIDPLDLVRVHGADTHAEVDHVVNRLPSDLMEILQRHVDTLPDGPMRESELLFPSTSGGYRAPSCLDKPIREIAKEAKIGKTLTPRFMRRTFQDLGRAASVHDFVVRAISGHATTTMQEHYSSVSGDEVRTGLAKVLKLAGIAKTPANQTRRAS